VLREEDDAEEAELFKDFLTQDEEEEANNGDQWVTYTNPSKLRLRGSMRHPGHIVEARSLAAVQPPAVEYGLLIWQEMIETGRKAALSALQLEAICYACQSHEEMMADGIHRCGFALGDGTGVGKGERADTNNHEDPPAPFPSPSHPGGSSFPFLHWDLSPCSIR
jgi:hypothetical protein